ncbi:hypothetical protein FOZ62_007302 [Perkinsus olseni]|uniref:Uncharacterized protein n=1 Tax=Perkinsus olseni TaxID=32597 RepID=A0A7J6P4L0_PEROL|nr:hypothetical protein FOZ62_007302 [Perkinsus olseni]
MAPATRHQLAAHQLHERPVRENFLRCPGCPDFACLSALSPLTIIPLLEEEPLLTWLHHHRLLTIDTPCRCGFVRKKALRFLKRTGEFLPPAWWFEENTRRKLLHKFSVNPSATTLSQKRWLRQLWPTTRGAVPSDLLVAKDTESSSS